MPTFLHAADLHIDSPLRGLDTLDEGLGPRVRNATQAAMHRLVDRALEAKVTFAVLAGDLFDGARQSVETAFFIGDELRRLTTEGIPVFLVRGNHDFLGERSSVVWPEGVVELPASAPDSVVRDDLGVAVHGQSFPTKHVTRDLTRDYPAPVRGLLNVGLLHTALEGHSGAHAPYAASSAASLATKGYAYWALGHVHSFKDLEEGATRIVYPGCLQGRHVGESGAHGAALVHYRGERVEGVERLLCDVLRWHSVDVSLDPSADLDMQVREAAKTVARATEANRAEVACAVRVQLRGLGPEGRRLRTRDLRERLLQALRHEDRSRLLLEELQLADELTEVRLPETLRAPLAAAHDALRDRSDRELAQMLERLYDEKLPPSLRDRLCERLGVRSREELAEKALGLGRERLEARLGR